MLYLTFLDNGFKFLTEKPVSNWKVLFSHAWNITFLDQASFKTILEEDSWDQILI